MRVGMTGRRPERWRRLRTVQLVAAGAMLLVAGLLLGCGGDDGGSNGAEEVFPPRIITDEEIDAQDDGSPGRALLEWWQAFQFGNADAVVDLTSRRTIEQIGKKNLTELVKVRGQALPGVEVLESAAHRSTASVRVGLLTFTPEKEGEPVPDEPTTAVPDTLAMKMEGGEWLFAEPEFLVPRVDELKAAQRQGKGDQK